MKWIRSGFEFWDKPKRPMVPSFLKREEGHHLSIASLLPRSAIGVNAPCKLGMTQFSWCMRSGDKRSDRKWSWPQTDKLAAKVSTAGIGGQ